MQYPAQNADAIKSEIHLKRTEREMEKRKIETLRAKLKLLEKQHLRAS
jgi:hypothetical protein